MTQIEYDPIIRLFNKKDMPLSVALHAIKETFRNDTIMLLNMNLRTAEGLPTLTLIQSPNQNVTKRHTSSYTEKTVTHLLILEKSKLHAGIKIHNTKTVTVRRY